MITRFFIYWLGIFSFLTTQGQLSPMAGDTLNYTQVMFDHPPVINADYYKLQIIQPEKDSSFRHPLMEIIDSAPSVMVSNLGFGKKYLWRFTGISHGKNTGWTGPYSFEIMNEDTLNKHKFKAFVLKNDTARNIGGLILADCNTVAYNRKGEAVWYLNFHGHKMFANPPVRDLRITNAGTVTCLFGKDAIECDLHGNELWRAPLKEAPPDDKPANRKELYHHDFKRLPNGNYMTLAGLITNRKLPSYIDTTKIKTDSRSKALNYYLKNINGSMHAMVSIGTIIEFDKTGKIVWQWNSDNYFTDEDLFPPGTDLSQALDERDTHLNAFSIDEKNEFVYAGFRNISRVIKIDKQSGKVIYSWGNRSLSGEPGDGQGFFKRQHNAQVLGDGSIAVFNNNTKEQKTSTAVIFSQPQGSDSSKIIWQMDCELDTIVKAKSTVGGNVDELPDKNLLICTGNTDRIFEVTRNQEVVWNAIAGRKTLNDTTASPYPLYRAHYVSSLYPCYFSLQQIKDSKEGALRLKIFNTGTENDSYTISSEAQTNNNTIDQETVEVAAGKSLIYTFTKVDTLKKDENFKISVRSKNKSDFKRALELKQN